MSREGISQGLGMIPSGVFVLAAAHEGQRSAILASFVQQAGFDPPAIVVAVGTDRPVRRMMESSGRFVIATMSSESKDSLKRFWKGVPDGSDPFEGLESRTSASGLPVPADAVGYVECELSQVVEVGDHCLCIGTVTGGDRINAAYEPMVRVRQNGFEY